MIQSNELRVGNWVEANSPMMQVKEITEHTVGLYMPGSEADLFFYDIDEIKPIPLSPEILEKCGFVYRNEHRGVGCIMDLGNIASVGILENGFRYLLLWQAPLKYLHQLQNIYFAHFGEELTYKQ